MNTFHLTQNITAFYIKANSFPDGVLAAHHSLHALIPFDAERRYFGISYGGPDRKVTYLAAASELVEGDLKKYNLPEFTIRGGTLLLLLL